MQINLDELVFRPFSPAENDMEFWLNAYRESFMERHPKLDEKYVVRAVETRQQELQWAMVEENHNLFMATLDNDTVGFYWVAIYTDEETPARKLMDIADLYVAPAYLRQSIGRHFLQRLEKEAREKQVRLMQFIAFAANKSLCNLILKVDFIPYRTDFIKELSESCDPTQDNGLKNTQFGQLEIRPFDLNRDDIELLIEGEREILWRSTLPFEREKASSTAYEATQERLQALNDENASFMIAYRQKDFVGYYLLCPCDNALSIDDFYVHPAFRRQGIGTYFIQHIATEAYAQNFSYLALQVSNHNTPMYNLVLKLGFQPLRIRYIKRLK